MSTRANPEAFTSSDSVISFFREQITQNGNPRLAGLEEEIVVLDAAGKPLSHLDFQAFLKTFIKALPEGKVYSGLSVHSDTIPVLSGAFAGGLIQPETNTTLVELAHSPAETAWGCYAQSRTFTAQLTKTASDMNLHVLGSGSVPSIKWGDMLQNDVVIPNADYVYSWNHMKEGTRPEYCRTVFGTASVHHNMGFNDPERMARYISTTLRMQPTMIALLGNAPLWDSLPARDGQGSQLLSYRSYVQADYGKIFGKKDGVSYLYPDFMIDPKASFSSLVNGYLDLPLDRTIVNGRKVSCNGLTMRSYLAGYEADGRTFYPDEKALTMMLREPIVDVRPNFVGSAPRVETRAHDCVSQHVAVSIDAFYRGIVENLDAVHDLTSGITKKEIRESRLRVCAHGLSSSLRHARREITTQKDMALSLLELADQGLRQRRHGEQGLLSPLWTIADSGANPGQRMLSVYKKDGNMQEVLSAIRYDRNEFADGSRYDWPQSPTRNISPCRAGAPSCSL